MPCGWNQRWPIPSETERERISGQGILHTPLNTPR
ncbi:hypothetical protein JMJ77_0011330 [Colletotrichum scovillei]|uniref:Uncharacterized protein n=1 Tax=Colletotrichum scovillei TaxID=1209932 RepID=A0A9P7UDM3_9PEZI|nr:hypothetical protein JMJ77_0011330 [Colletotrichum scovillei]KAG7060308.1 hypothetical protein JMJ78_0015583 [Colletotrichum scovillei]KAG7067759.1 hypothetical protein JMJ76_0009187 [Colletotrichum scovillei]